MQVTETLSEGLKREFQVKVPAADLEARVQGRLSELKDRAHLRGFRPGKVPVTHLRKIYGRSVMAETVEAVIREMNAKIIEEFAEANTAMQQASSLASLNGKPLIVLTADRGINDAQWQVKQNHLATLSTKSLHRHADATHESLLDDQADSAAASQAIQDVVASIRASQQLASR